MANEKNFILITDSASNITEDLLKKYDIKMLPYIISVDGADMYCYEEDMDFEASSRELLSSMKNGAAIKTSLINGDRFRDFAEPYLKAGSDVMFISMSSGISGTYNSVANMCAELSLLYPQRKCLALDTQAASLGEGVLVLLAAKLRQEGKSIDEVFNSVEEEKKKLRQVFTVDDLGYLLRGGRISRLTAVVGTLLHVKPILCGENGKIVSCGKVKGRKKALDSLVEDYIKNSAGYKNEVIAIADFAAKEDAQYVADKIRESGYAGEFLMRTYDLCTCTYVGPGCVALFFRGKNN